MDANERGSKAFKSEARTPCAGEVPPAPSAVSRDDSAQAFFTKQAFKNIALPSILQEIS